MNESDLVELRYQSQAVHDMGILGLTRILDVAIPRNARLGITGILFFDKGYFGQILEGNRADIEVLWASIQKDQRHHKIELLGISTITKRRFPKWAMKLFDVQEFSSAFPKFSEVIDSMTDQDLKALDSMSSLWFPA
ncbi:BLUF domain-containing protein [Polynucleobacter sp. AP-Reno-20A-A9]|uniref:BLUF domain-containing protein n=1 Tax=Polynucleobacter sp. AP-Reno-20A-A9 TaxID=2576925 RepID=UPI001C0AB20B|nr:BLUF domain-containing protein [Polynucleobacter sp. AP-Reno-20A-A9]